MAADGARKLTGLGSRLIEGNGDFRTARVARRPTALFPCSRDLQSVRITVIALSAVWIACATAAAAQDGERLPSSRRGESEIMRVPVRGDSRVWLEGSSNVRDWTCKATVMEATIEVESRKVAGGPDLSTASVRNVTVKVPVRMLKCGDRHMEANMYDALKAPKTPATYITAEFNRIPRPTSELQEIEAPGRMTVAGVERPVVMTVRTDRLADGTTRAAGRVPILMTDFGITPPHPWMGILRTANKVVIQFEIFVAAQPLQSARENSAPAVAASGDR